MKYVVIDPLMHDGMHTPKGSIVDLTAEQASHLGERVTLIEEPRSETKKPVEPKPGDSVPPDPNASSASSETKPNEPNIDNQKSKP